MNIEHQITTQANKQESLAIPHCSQNEKIKNGARRKEANQNPGETNYNRTAQYVSRRVPGAFSI